VSAGNRRASGRFNWQFKLLELDDDGRFASITKEKFGFGLAPGGSDPASVTNLNSAGKLGHAGIQVQAGKLGKHAHRLSLIVKATGAYSGGWKQRSAEFYLF
jgi:hypothetical protein